MEYCQFVRNRAAVGPFLENGLGAAIHLDPGSSLTARLCHFRLNVAEGFEGGLDYNLSADPPFCDSTARNFDLRRGSPCEDDSCGLIGAFPVACPPNAVNPIIGPGIELLIGSSNPGRPPFTLAFRLDGSAVVRLEIVDIAGRLVTPLEVGVVRAGRHERTWSGLDASGRAVGPGIYFARLRAGGVSLTRKLVILR